MDLNVLLDVVQEREVHLAASRAVLERVTRGKEEASLAAHAVTTLHYLVGRYNDRATADEAVDRLLLHFGIVPIGRAELLRARSLGWSDFEDAVVAAAAESAGCRAVVTCNVKDFKHAQVPSMTPEEYLASLHPV